MNILLVDDHEMFRDALRRFLGEMGEELGKELAFFDAGSVPAALRFGDAMDLVVLDMQMKEGPCGTEALAAMRTALPDTRIVVVSGTEERALIEKCLDLGALGFVPKSYSSSVLKAAITMILRDAIYLPPVVLQQGCAEVQPARPANVNAHPALAALSPRQRQALNLLMTGKSNKTIARELDIAHGTVKAHLQGLYRALGVPNRTAAVCLMARLGVEFDSASLARTA